MLPKCFEIQSYWHPKIGPLCEEHRLALSKEQIEKKEKFSNRKERRRDSATKKRNKKVK